jgi:uncharacterized protein (DUF934 family)
MIYRSSNIADIARPQWVKPDIELSMTDRLRMLDLVAVQMPSFEHGRQMRLSA